MGTTSYKSNKPNQTNQSLNHTNRSQTHSEPSSQFTFPNETQQTTIDPSPSDEDNVLDAVAIAINVMSPTCTVPCPTVIQQNSVTSVTSTAASGSSEIVENESLHSNSIPPKPPEVAMCTDYTTNAYHPSLTSCYSRRSSNLIHPRSSNLWKKEEIDEVAYEMRCQMRLLRSQ
eukprot:705349_1